jgi:uncharacterized RDD family membrane protein YckC
LAMGDHSRRRKQPEITLPERTVDRVLLGLGAAALLAVVPMLWIWLLYGSAFSGSRIYAAATGLCALAAVIGGAMIRILDGER